MTKRILALIMAGVLSCSAAAVTFADEVVSVDYSMINDEVYDGTWVTCFQTFDVYLPSDWTILVNEDVTAAPENSVYFSAANDDQTQSVSISYAASEYTDINDLAAVYAEQEGFTEVQVIDVNGIACVSYEVTTEGVWTTGLVALGDQGGLYNVSVGCAEDQKDEFATVAANILVSFSATEMGEEGEEEVEDEEVEDEEAEEE